ncbi:hypothetical protein [Pseudodesulfovibrio sp.]|uniref:hypothetical protein n=1 Tax=Pseudodesulfovibrio sp. TaxID=2035812 RepID=UPI0026353AB4|nr:hypothetical protein [Pseudodesulfovibrio sp.]MDD3310993.1 hypothetical protein [Pseudodesulfovibrio sp.]
MSMKLAAVEIFKLDWSEYGRVWFGGCNVAQVGLTLRTYSVWLLGVSVEITFEVSEASGRRWLKKEINK